MKLKITTTYENCDQEFIDWYMKRLANENVMPGSTGIVETLKTEGYAVFESSDPTSDVTAKTEYEVIDGR